MQGSGSMKRGRIDRGRSLFRETPVSIASGESTDSATATLLLSDSTALFGPSAGAESHTTYGDPGLSKTAGHCAADRIPWHDSWAKKIETRRSGGSIAKSPEFPKGPPSNGDFTPYSAYSWRLIGCVSLIIAVIAFWHGTPVDPRYQTFMPAEWHWDHNIYMPTVGGGAGGRDASASLIAQVVPGAALSQLGDISMRPNRAYARQWGLDFARYDSGRPLYDPRGCFEKVAVLNEILDQQSNDTSDGKYSWQRDYDIEYDSILLLPADAILMELDTDVLGSILPPGQDKLVAIAGWTEHDGLHSNSDIIFFNLKHRHTEAVARLWLEMAASMEMTCGDNNDLGMLVTAIATVVDGTDEVSRLIQPLEETADGFVGDRLIKTVSIAVPESRTAFLYDFLQQSVVSLQGTADSVCFRFFPKCEVLPAA